MYTKTNIVNDKINIFIAGDSTVKSYGKQLATGGWGEYLQSFLNKNYINVVNFSNGGRSTRSFLNEGSLKKIEDLIGKGDFLLIQFGHNDSANQNSYLAERYVPLGKPDKNNIFPVIPGKQSLDGTYTYDSGGTYKWFLLQYINIARKAGATPILCTPVARLYFDEENVGRIRPHHDASDTVDKTKETFLGNDNTYVEAVKQLAKEENIILIDMFELTKDVYENVYNDDPLAAKLSSPLAIKLFLHGDFTHNNKTGAFLLSILLAKEIKTKDISIANYIIQPERVVGESPAGDEFIVKANKEIVVYTADNNGKYTIVDSYWTEKFQSLSNSLE